MKTVCINILFLLVFPFIASAADEEKPVDAKTTDEKPMVSEVPTSDHSMLRHEGLPQGFQPLTVAGQKIDATYLEETRGDYYGVIVFLHDQGEQFENQVISPLRQTFPEYGWSTLTLVLDYPFEPKIYLSGSEIETSDNKTNEKDSDKPAEPKTAEPEKKQEKTVDSAAEDKPKAETVLPAVSNIERVQAALEFVKSKDIEKIIFVGHGAGGNLAIELLETLSEDVSALVLIGTSEIEADQVFETLEFPILDIIGSNDHDDVKPAAMHRKKLMKQVGNSLYAVREIQGADHVFYGMQPQLTLTLRSWLNKHFVEQNTE
jgi:predicted alpha/beta hydrolase family esterase